MRCKMSAKKPLIIAHRGAAGEAPENTLASFKLAVEQECDAIELDIHLSADDEIVVCHDATIDRTTNGSGVIREMKVEELKQYDAGSWFSPKFKDEKIPLLEEVLDIIPKEVLINIEIKNIPMFYPEIEEKVLDLLIEKGRVETAIISSFDHQCLKKMKLMNDKLKVGLLYSCNLVNDVDYVKLFGEAEVYSMHPSRKILSKDDVVRLVENQLEVYPYTINDEALAKDLLDYGVTGLITDYPGKINKLLQLSS